MTDLKTLHLTTPELALVHALVTMATAARHQDVEACNRLGLVVASMTSLPSAPMDTLQAKLLPLALEILEMH